nr:MULTISPECIES: iron-siderophore ABC transporter substrate-binding protein [unclassified Actinomyces]
MTGAVLPLGALLAACGSTGPAGSSGGGTTITHAFGTTEVPTEVSRIASVNWANQDVALALGIMPVGFAAQTWGVEDGSGMLAWTKEKVDELVAAGAEQPVLFDETDGIDYEAVAATTPDIILAAYSGLDQESYDTLTKIAPTVAYPSFPWTTPWREMITMDSQAMNKEAEGKALISDLEQQITEALAPYPQIRGKAGAFFYATPADMSSIGYYTPGDPRTGFLADLGMSVPPSVQAAADADPETFFVQVAAENADTLSDVDLMVMYGDGSELAALQADPLLGTIPAIKNGAIAWVGNGTPLSASTNPGPLSIPWGIKEYLRLLGEAASKVA